MCKPMCPDIMKSFFLPYKQLYAMLLPSMVLSPSQLTTFTDFFKKYSSLKIYVAVSQTCCAPM